MKNETSQLNAAIIITYITIPLDILFSVFLTPHILSYFGNQQYAIYQVAATIVGYFSVADMGVGSAMVHFISKSRTLRETNKERSYLFVFQTFYTAVTFLIIVVGLFLYNRFDIFYAQNYTRVQIAHMKSIFLLLLFNLIMRFICSPFVGYITANKKFFVDSLTNLCRIVLRTVLLFVVVFTRRNQDILQIAVVDTIGSGLLCTFNAWYCVAIAI
ncbi:hypothetical protein AGMMS49992_28400 [Clostridia bacterium]|nr:hypothetical protein AGMMS49992_28400 [Clostridia bacterium]